MIYGKMKIRMRKFSLLVFIFVFFFSLAHAGGEYNGNWHRIGQISDDCDFIGNAKLVINYKVVKIKVEKWRWLDNSEFGEKFFKGKFKKNNTNIFIQSRGIGYKHALEGIVNNNRIFLTFSSTHTKMNEKYGGCTFEFVRE